MFKTYNYQYGWREGENSHSHALLVRVLSCELPATGKYILRALIMSSVDLVIFFLQFFLMEKIQT